VDYVKDFELAITLEHSGCLGVRALRLGDIANNVQSQRTLTLALLHGAIKKGDAAIPELVHT